ncbi:hypothetical protein B0T20DRAFT_346198, partial [Sordaria brevicollis]
GTLFKRSTINIIGSIAYNIKDFLEYSLFAALITFDVKNAFNTILINYLILRLKE